MIALSEGTECLRQPSDSRREPGTELLARRHFSWRRNGCCDGQAGGCIVSAAVAKQNQKRVDALFKEYNACKKVCELEE